MALDYRKCAEEIYSHLGGRENIVQAAHCATRLRLVLADNSKIDKKALEDVEGVKILTAPFRFCLYGYSGFNEETGEFLINDEALDNPAVAIDSMYVDYNSLDKDDDASGAFLNHLFKVFKGLSE